ncbi:peptide-methionine (S)-S-oxide reductase MsrA [Pseudanabaena sp. FACHB-2040]|nr:peptide-methionine (S)-S-oxide reductase MsrA [Pseudanabaena sp. FACHB-2040]MBD2257071.1 peptide-methionine (S)-S-oxide reductase MsrA [Pseudanabaena sp. FACHB-2040]
MGLLASAVLLWDALPFYATASPAVQSSPASQSLATATFAGGCFWCMEPPFDHLEGVVATTSGYTGGTQENPTYYEVSAGTTGHVEAVQVTYDPAQVSYAQLLEVFWQNVDPLDDTGQFCDKGSQYHSAIFAATAAEQQLAEQSKQSLQATKQFKRPVVTEVRPTQIFYPAEEYHQDYYLKHPVRYKFYRNACGRDQRLAELWGQD